MIDEKLKKENADLKNRINKMNTIFEEILKENDEDSSLMFLYNCFKSIFGKTNKEEITKLFSYRTASEIHENRKFHYVFLPETLTKFVFIDIEEAMLLYKALSCVSTPVMFRNDEILVFQEEDTDKIMILQ